MSDKITIMISSLGLKLKDERLALKEALKDNAFVELLGSDPFSEASISGSPAQETLRIARECDLYILILSESFGFELPDGKSATEVEFDTAFQADPTKILVFIKKDLKDDDVEPAQLTFIKRVCDYFRGYWRTEFSNTGELTDLAKQSFQIWLKKRASLGTDLTYLDHFVRIAKQERPEPNAEVLYTVTKHEVKITYKYFKQTYTIVFDAKEIYRNFWGCISQLLLKFREWNAL